MHVLIAVICDVCVFVMVLVVCQAQETKLQGKEQTGGKQSLLLNLLFLLTTPAVLYRRGGRGKPALHS